jgi:hypothetical protein
MLSRWYYWVEEFKEYQEEVTFSCMTFITTYTETGKLGSLRNWITDNQARPEAEILFFQ